MRDYPIPEYTPAQANRLGLNGYHVVGEKNPVAWLEKHTDAVSLCKALNDRGGTYWGKLYRVEKN